MTNKYYSLNNNKNIFNDYNYNKVIIKRKKEGYNNIFVERISKILNLDNKKDNKNDNKNKKGSISKKKKIKINM